ncbi:MAG: hypothetical protein RJB38_1419 [Pseudomonadota bacterium]
MMPLISSLFRKPFVVLLLVSATGAGCAKVRTPSFPNGSGENIFEVALFSKTDMSLETETRVDRASDSAKESRARKLRPVLYASKTQVRAAKAPAGLQPMFKELEISGMGEKTYGLRFRVNRKFVTAFRVVEQVEELSPPEQELIQRSATGEALLPLFQYPVKSYGRVVRAKNDLGEETSTLELKATSWSEATHVQLSTLLEDRVAVAPAEIEQGERIFSKTVLEGEVFSKAELESELDVRVAREGRFTATLDGAELLLQELLSLDDASVSASQREQIRAVDRGTGKSRDIARCTESEARRSGVKDCVKVARYRVPVSYVQASLKVIDSEGHVSADLQFKPARREQAQLVRLEKDALAVEVGTSSLDPRRSLRVAEASKWEFLFRRTLEDSPNSFDFTFAGSSGPLEIVRLIFEKDRLRVVRADPMIPTRGGNRNDLTDLMSLPVQYFREDPRDSQGHLLASPRLIPCEPGHPDAVASVSWEGNSIPPISSALNYYELGQCFAGSTDVTASSVDNRFEKDGLLSFSLSTTYLNAPGTDCGGVLSAGYFDQVQSTFTFQERYSFKKYALIGTASQKSAEVPLLAIPYEAQKKLGFGIFTYSKKTPNSYGNVGTDGTVTPLPALFDLRGGKKIRYVLAGLPGANEDPELRARLIAATREVIADWNEAFRRAFVGTSFERSGDVLELQVEGEAGAPVAALGDLDVNHIYYIPKRTSSGVIGLGGAHSNPRSGKVEAASVFIYGGNILSFVERMKEMRAAREQFRKELASPLVQMPQAPGNLMTPAASRASSQAGLGSRSTPSLAPLGGRQAAALKARSGRSFGTSIEERREMLSRLKGRPSELAFYEAFMQGAQEGALSNVPRMSGLISEKLLRVLSARGARDGLESLRATAKRSNTLATLVDRLTRAHVCVHEAPELSRSMIESDQEQSDLDLVIGVYKPTLAHEIGHNLGLRHNFISSYDRANWKFATSDSSKRDYSSVMDYLSEDDHYDGMGPQDVAAIRAAYAGVLESIKGEKLSLDQVLARAKASSWNQLTSDGVRAAEVKPYQFCSDEDAGQTPICNRFDRGTTPAEIVQASIDDYRELYRMRNFAGNKLNFSVLGSGEYVGRTMARFMPIRQFLEETIYQAIQGSDEVNGYAEAAIAGMEFFHSVVRTPDASPLLNESERVMAAQLEDNRTVKVERKWLKDVRFDRESDRLRIRGIEFDKVISLMMLTERQLGFSRYEEANLRFSYPEFERMVFGGKVKSPLELPTYGLLAEVLSNQVTPYGVVLAENGKSAGMIPLDSRFSSEVTEMMRMYAIMGGVVFQDVDGLDVSSNGSRLFQVFSAFSQPASAAAVLRPGASKTDGDQLKYWAPEGALVAKSLIDRMQLLEQIQGLRGSLMKSVEQVSGKMTELAQARSAQPVDPARLDQLKGELMQLLVSANEELAKLPAAAGVRKLEVMLGALDQVTSAASALEQAAKDYEGHALQLAVEQRRSQIVTMMRQNPVLAELLLAVADAPGMSEFFKVLVSSYSNDSERGLLFSNLEIMNRLLLSAHPELKR